ncbi:MAG: hypothetical protein HY814_13415, partial [Candidatus Riflebacteria bacterium]|nr:hypothetical protein [Candidatus Riflebacteria bacterium]
RSEGPPELERTYTASDVNMTPDAQDENDPVVEAYKPGVDRTLLLENLKRSPTERLRRLQAMYEFWLAARRAKALEPER